MKKFYRYMSAEEFVKMSKGIDVKSYNIAHTGSRTDSEGFCFLGEKTIVCGEEVSPIDCYRMLEGIVSGEILVEFEADDDIEIHEGYGRYASPFRFNEDELVNMVEYSMLQYNKSFLKPKRFVVGPHYYYGDETTWNDFSDDKDYDIRKLLFQYEEKAPRIKETDSVKFLPSIPGTPEDEMWRIIRSKSENTYRLVYGDPITDVNRYEVKFFGKEALDDNSIQFGSELPEGWKKIMDILKHKDKKGLRYDELLPFMAILGSYPQLQDIYDIDLYSLTPAPKYKNSNIPTISDVYDYYNIIPKADEKIDIEFRDENDEYVYLNEILSRSKAINDKSSWSLNDIKAGIKSANLDQPLQ